MADRSLAEKLAEYENISASKEVPEAGAGHYLKRGALQGVSALADLVPNLYNLGKAAIGAGPFPPVMSAITGRPKSEFMPEAGQANPIGQFLLEGYHLNEPVRPSADIGGKFGAAILEGAGAAAGQGPMGLARQAPLSMIKELALQEARNAVIGGAAGGGAELGGEVAGTPGAIIGGLAAGVAVPSSFIRKGGVTIGAIRSAAQTAEDIKASDILNKARASVEPGFSDYVQGTIKGAVAGTPAAAENIQEGLRLRQQIPGFNPSVAEMANSQGLIDIQKKFALLNPKNLNAEVSRGETNTKAIQDFYRTKVPVAEAPASVRSSVNQSIAEYEKLLETQAQRVAGKLPQNVNQFGIGTALSDAAQAEKAAARPPITQAYENAFKAAGETKVSSEGIVAKVEDILGEKLSQIKPSNAPQTVSTIQRIFGDKGKTMEGRSVPPDLMALEEVGGKKEVTLKDLHDIKVAVGQDVASAGRSLDPTASTRLYNLRQVMPEVDAAIEKMPPAAKNAYNAAVEKYKTEFAPRFKEGANLRVFRDTSLNEPKILPDKFVSEYFKPDAQAGGSRAIQFSRLFGQNPEAKDLARTGIMDIYSQKVVNPTTGSIDQTAHESFLRDYGRTLESYRMGGVDAVTDIKRIGQEAAKVSKSMDEFRSLSKTLKFDTVDELVTDALKNPKTMGNTIVRLSSDRRGTFNTLLLDKAFESGTASGMRQFLETNQKTLSMTVPKEQLSAIQDVAKALEMAERAPIKGNIAAGGADMLKNATGISAATVFAQVRAVTANRSSIEWGAINLAMPALNKMTQTSFANVMENALHNPQTAVALRNYLLAETPQQANKWATQILNSIKMGGKLAWSAKGPIVSNFIGPERYGENLARTGTAIRSQLQPDQP